MQFSDAKELPGTGLAVAAGTPGADPRPHNIILSTQDRAAVRQAVKGLDAWLDSTRQPGGYAGPVAHWWRDCLDYTGPGLDWRYEGIIIGYLNLWAATGEKKWLDKARRAGDDLVNGQLPNGNYRNSCFELNPNTGGTPHEAACDLALLRQAEALRSVGDQSYEKYVQTAQRNLMDYFIGRLWDPARCSFRDDPNIASFVPNKACTLVEALFAFSKFNQEAKWAEDYALPTLKAVLEHQVSSGVLDGAICQNSFGKQKIEKYFPYYIARCIPALLEGWAWSGEERFAEAVIQAAGFILRYRFKDGSFPQVIYPGERVNRYPQWVAAVGDILRLLDLSRALGVAFNGEPTFRWLMSGRKADGSFGAAVGFGKASPGRQREDSRDGLGVVGWNDKVFRFLTGCMLYKSPDISS